MSRLLDYSPSYSSWTETHTEYGPGTPYRLPGYGQQLWDHQAPCRVCNNTRSGTSAAEHRPLEEIISTRPFGGTSVPVDPYSRPARIVIVNSSMDHGISHQPTPFLRQVMHRPLLERNSHTPRERDESRLTKEQQNIVLTKIQRQIYNPVPKMARKVSLYYRDLNRDANVNTSGRSEDEDGKNCVVCLEDFKAGEEVMLTPCKHMFHEECIVPWVQNRGKCPICRSVLYNSIRENDSDLDRSGGSVQQAAEHGLFADELLTLIQTVEEAFVLGA